MNNQNLPESLLNNNSNMNANLHGFKKNKFFHLNYKTIEANPKYNIFLKISDNDIEELIMELPINCTIS